MNDSPFVGRESELETLTNTVTGEDPESLIPVVGTTGSVSRHSSLNLSTGVAIETIGSYTII